MADEQKVFTWETLDGVDTDKTPDWFWALAILAAAGAGAAIVLGNALFGIVILIGAGVIALYAIRRPDAVSVRINKKGVAVGTTRYPYDSLDAFWILDEDETNEDGYTKLLISPRRILSPDLSFVLPDDIDPEELRVFLLDYLPEEEMVEPFADRVAEFFGL